MITREATEEVAGLVCGEEINFGRTLWVRLESFSD